MDEELTGNQDRIDMNHNGEIDADDFHILRGMDEEEMGQQEQPMSTGELMDMIDNMSATDLIQFLKDAGSDIKSKVMSMISSGADKTRDYLNQRYPENEGALYEGKLSINRAIDQMDALIDGLSDPKKKVKTQK
jgi:Mg/Co/Ni transporter MgtE